MKQPDEGREWVRRWTASVAEALKAARGRMSAQQLSERCAGLGYPIPRSTITNLEIGRKESISIQEVAVLAKALGIPPLSLVFPIGRERTVEILPGAEVPTWLAAQWFTGEATFPVPLPDGGWGTNDNQQTWKTSAPFCFRLHSRLLKQWNDRRNDLRRARQSPGSTGDTEALEVQEELVRAAEDELRRYRELMRQVGLTPNALPEELAHLDQED
ncbi:MAG: helix-turn-helix domain-containing protein [Actinomycetota bacterium]|nr:helix-turn-helix domain-containing protein [Actinomycetota bacterium]